MKVEVMVDKDNTHFKYEFECDKIIDGREETNDGRLVVLKKIGKINSVRNEYKTIAVFNIWTYWRVIPKPKKGDEKIVGHFLTDYGPIGFTNATLKKLDPNIIKDQKCFIYPCPK